METIRLSGLNKNLDRVSLILISDGAQHIVGQVRKPAKLHDGYGNYIFFVNADEMTYSAKQVLERNAGTGRIVEFHLDGESISGTIGQVSDGLGAGSFDGINIPQDRIVMINLTCPALSRVEVDIPFEPDTVQRMVLQMLGHKGWEQIFVRNCEEAGAFKCLKANSEESDRFQFTANWKYIRGGSKLCIQIMEIDGSDNQLECDRLLNEIVEPIVTNRFSPPFDKI